MNDAFPEKIANVLESKVASRIIGPLSQEEISIAIQTIKNTSDIERKNSSTLQLAYHLAVTGNLDDLYLATELTLNADLDPYNRKTTITVLCNRFEAIEDKQQALKLVNAMEKDATTIKTDSSFYPAQRASLWMRVAELYHQAGDINSETRARAAAISLAAAGQYQEDDPQDSDECMAILGHIIKTLTIQGKYQLALEVAKLWEWQHKDRWVNALKSLSNSSD